MGSGEVVAARSGARTATNAVHRLHPRSRSGSPRLLFDSIIWVAADAGAAMAAILAAVASGNACLAEASELAKLVDGFIRATEATEKFEREQELDDLLPMLGPRSRP